jgi:hypothetical protein
MRALCYIKATFPAPTFESIWLTLFQKLWTPPNQIDITKPDLLRGVLSESGLFKASEIDGILNAAGQKEWKDKLLVSALILAPKSRRCRLCQFGGFWKEELLICF